MRFFFFVNPSIVLVPTYPETILYDPNGYSATEYVELTERLIEDVSDEYAVDAECSVPYGVIRLRI
ncbi:MAG: hypothetical protein K6D38_09565 [Pseudobutyrivibrio sp.]|nr:hypothetical protein [Pseudobutyrivibrio sp.]